MLWQMPKQRSQMLKRKFADGQNLLRLAASHALTLVPSPQAERPSTASPPNLPLALWTGIVLSCSSAEAGEGRAQTEENIAQSHMRPTQSGTRMFQGLHAVRQHSPPLIHGKSRMRINPLLNRQPDSVLTGAHGLIATILEPNTENRGAVCSQSRRSCPSAGGQTQDERHEEQREQSAAPTIPPGGIFYRR